MSFGTETEGFAYIGREYNDELLHSTDGGLTWAEVTPKQSNGNSLSLGGTSCAIAFADERNGWLAIDNRILATNDGGTTWSETTIAGISRIYALHMIDAENGWGAADNGTILRYAVF